MRHLQALLRSMVFSAFALVVLAAPAYAQSPSPTQKGGICAPWHHCIAEAFMAAVVLYLAFVGIGYMIQRKGFDKVEHRQGNPDGVPTDKR